MQWKGSRFLYVNCNRIIYQRYPYSTTAKNLRIQVINPSYRGGKFGDIGLVHPEIKHFHEC